MIKKLLALLLTFACVVGLIGCDIGADNMIGTVSGAENEYIIIGDATYLKDHFNDFSNKDRGKYLGSVANEDITMRVYAVKGDDSGNFIYALWDWEGEFYVRQ